MGKFHDLIDAMRVGTASDSIYDDLTQEFNARDEYASNADAKVAELDGALNSSAEEISGRDIEISRLKSALYDNMNSKAAEEPTSEDGNADSGEASDEGVDGMFDDNDN